MSPTRVKVRYDEEGEPILLDNVPLDIVEDKDELPPLPSEPVQRQTPQGERPISKLVDGQPANWGKIQAGYVVPPPPRPETKPEVETEAMINEKKVLARWLKYLVPKITDNKLTKMPYSVVIRFFREEVSPLIQDEILERYKDISP